MNKIGRIEGLSPPPGDNSEELARKLSRTVLYTAERGRQSLFRRMTAANAEKIAELLKKKPVFYKNEKDAPREILLDPVIADVLPDEFFKNPTQWIESQRNIERGYENETVLLPGEKIGELFDSPYDVSKVKEFTFDMGEKKIKVVSKRLDPMEGGEIALARKAWEAGIPTAKVLGEILDHGNLYAFFEKINAVNMEVALEKKNLSFSSPNPPIGESIERMLLWLSHENYFPRLSQEAIQKIEQWWRKSYPHSTRNTILNKMENFLFYVAKGEKTIADSIAGTLRKMASAYSGEVELVLKSYGFNTLAEFKRISLPEWRAYLGLDEIALQKLIWRVKEDEEKSITIARQSHNEFEQIVYEDIVGFHPRIAASGLEELCREEGIFHKDLSRRNILVEWDFKKDVPIRGGNGKAKLYLIDWEPKPKTPPSTQGKSA